MLPDWDFENSEVKRRTFITCVWRELDRFASLAGIDRSPNDDGLDWAAILEVAQSPRGRKRNPATGMNALIWEYALLRFMFNRYWPGRKRKKSDPAHAANIAVARCKPPLPLEQRSTDRLEARIALRDLLLDEWERRAKNPGWEQAQHDIAVLEALPPTLLAR